MTELKTQLEGLEKRLIGMDWKATVPDDVQSEVRMLFNEALAGGPNMNGDGGPLLTPDHALDCVWAAQRIEALTRALSHSPDRLREAQLEQREAVRRVGNLFHKTRLTHEVQVDPDDLYHVLVAAGYYNHAALATPNAQEGEA